MRLTCTSITLPRDRSRVRVTVRKTCPPRHPLLTPLRCCRHLQQGGEGGVRRGFVNQSLETKSLLSYTHQSPRNGNQPGHSISRQTEKPIYTFTTPANPPGLPIPAHQLETHSQLLRQMPGARVTSD